MSLGLGTKAASVLGLASVIVEAHDMGKRKAEKGRAQASADKFVRDEISDSKLNINSSKHKEIKSFTSHLDLADRWAETKGYIGGYLMGVGQCLKNNILTVGFGTLGMFAKSKVMRTVALFGMGASILYDTITNATGLFDKNDYLDE